MGWYLKQSIRVGPIRFNLSKSGIGTSVGVKGFRIGMRPNGTSYVHAGGYGLYYREELGRRATTNHNQTSATAISRNVINYSSVPANALAHDSRKELLNTLNNSYKNFRLDCLVNIIFFILAVWVFNENSIEGSIVTIMVGLIAIYTSRWESKRRTVTIEYDFEDKGDEQFKRIISAFNNLASNRNLWSLIDSRNIGGTHESKLNAGAGNIINRSNAQIGEGKPPWVNTNINVPVMKARGQSLYMMPDGILVYDQNGVGFVAYGDVRVTVSTTRFIEERPPSDATIVDNTWKHPNKNGGPDKRFKTNYKIPICQYGNLKIESNSGLLLYLMTSKNDTPSKFKSDFLNP